MGQMKATFPELFVCMVTPSNNCVDEDGYDRKSELVQNFLGKSDDVTDATFRDRHLGQTSSPVPTCPG
jgi:hypothetical protein